LILIFLNMEVTFAAYVKTQQEKAKESRDATASRKELTRLQTLKKTLTKRHQHHYKTWVEGNIKALEVLIERKETGVEEAELQEKLQKYVNAFTSAGGSNQAAVVAHLPARARSPTRKRKKNEEIKKEEGSSEKVSELRDSILEASDRAVYNQQSVFNELMSELEKKQPPVYVVQGDICSRCNIPMIILASDALLGCPKCSYTRLYIQATSARIAYGEEVEFANFSYKRQNHFQEWLNTFQAKESTEVPDTVVSRVMEHLYQHQHIRTSSDISQKLVRAVLKDLKLRKYYDHAPQITARITGVLPPRMTPFQAEQVKLMFSAIQGPFNIHCPPERTNFLSYGYCLFKFCELLGYDDFLPCFTLLKGKDKLASMDKIWENICIELDWQFIPSK
jgi:DNA-directed RNA polymerase subunit RPC12/RpoP